MAKTSTRRILITILIVIALVVVGLVAFTLGRGSDDQSQTEANPEPSTQQEQPVGDDSNPASGQADDNTTTQEDQVDGISISEAEQTTLDRFGGTVTEAKADTHNGTPVWEIDVDGSDEGDIEVKVDRQTGEIVAWERN